VSNLSELLPAGGGQNNFTFTASGAVSNGDAVVLNSDGTVTSVGNVAAAIGSIVEISTQTNINTRTTSSAYDSTNNKVVIAYQGSSNYGYAVVGTISGSTVSYGTPVAWTSTSIERPSIAFGNGKVVVSYKDQTGGTKARVGTVSGTSISFGNAETIDSNATAGDNSIAYHAAENKFVVALQDNGSSSYGKASVGTVSGTTISFGSQATFESAYTLLEGRGVVYDSTNEKIVIIYTDSADNNRGTAVVGTVSGTSISFGTVAKFGSSTFGSLTLAATFDASAGKIVVAGREGQNSYAAYAVGTVSGTNISFGTETVFLSESIANRYSSIEYMASAKKVVISTSSSSSGGLLHPGTVSGTSISFDSTTASGADADYTVAALSDDTAARKMHVTFSDPNNSQRLSGRAFSPIQTNLTSTSFIGLAAQAISNSATGTVNTVGSLNESQSGLTIGSDYYVQEDGTISTTSTSPAVKIGQAIKATTINMKNRS
tara:strand:- start:5998 stop:7461 length:1464 start_codon:yes stop_codon:yes gene_type:complete